MGSMVVSDHSSRDPVYVRSKMADVGLKNHQSKIFRFSKVIAVQGSLPDSLVRCGVYELACFDQVHRFGQKVPEKPFLSSRLLLIKINTNIINPLEFGRYWFLCFDNCCQYF